MDLKVLFTVFAAVFIAELGDKTQLATLLFAADKEVSKFTVFLGASLALVVASGIGVLADVAQSMSTRERLVCRKPRGRACKGQSLPDGRRTQPMRSGSNPRELRSL